MNKFEKLAQAIFEPNLFPCKYLNMSQI